MKRKLKKIFSYIILFIESIILLLLTTLVVFKFTIFDKSYVKNKFDNKYYEKLYKEIKTEMTYYTNQSGFEDSVLDNIFTLTDVRNASNKFITSLYSGEIYELNTIEIEKSLNSNINEYIKKQNFQITNQDEINKFTKQISSVYVDEIKLMGYLDGVCKYIPKVIDLCDYIILFLSIIFIILLTLNVFVLKRKDYSIILYTCAFIMIFILVSIKNSIDISNLLIYSNTISNTVISIIKEVFNLCLIISLCYILLGFLYSLFKKEKIKRKKNNYL